MLPVHEWGRNIRANFIVLFLQAISLSAAEGDFAIPKFPANLTKSSSPAEARLRSISEQPKNVGLGQARSEPHLAMGPYGCGERCPGEAGAAIVGDLAPGSSLA